MRRVRTRRRSRRSVTLWVWQKAMVLAERVYRFSKGLPRDDQSVLGHQIRKSWVSVPSNIAEGFGRHSTAEYVHHLRFSKGSINELQTQVELARRFRIGGEAESALIITDAEEIGRHAQRARRVTSAAVTSCFRLVFPFLPLPPFPFPLSPFPSFFFHLPSPYP